MYTFKALEASDYYLLYNWLNEPHVIDFYTRQKINIEGIIAKYELWESGEVPKHAFIIYQDDLAIGMVSRYALDDFPNYQFELELDQATGLEVVIGKEEYFYKGLLGPILEAFVEDQKLHGQTLFAACALDNIPAIKAFTKIGFVFHKEVFNVDARDMENIYVKK